MSVITINISNGSQFTKINLYISRYFCAVLDAVKTEKEEEKEKVTKANSGAAFLGHLTYNFAKCSFITKLNSLYASLPKVPPSPVAGSQSW